MCHWSKFPGFSVHTNNPLISASYFFQQLRHQLAQALLLIVANALNPDCKFEWEHLITLVKSSKTLQEEKRMKKVMVQLLIVGVVVSGYVLPVFAAGGAGF